MFQEDTAYTKLEYCRHLHNLCLHNCCPQRWGPDSILWASRPSIPAAWLALLFTKTGDVESNPGPTTHTNKHTPVIWIRDLYHKQIHKKQTLIRCNHTHNTHAPNGYGLHVVGAPQSGGGWSGGLCKLYTSIPLSRPPSLF